MQLTMIVNRLLAFAMFAMILSACDGGAYAPGTDLYLQRAAADAMLQATQDAAYYAAMQSTAQAETFRQQMMSTQSAFALQQTAGAGTAQAVAQQAQATRTADVAQATQAAMVAQQTLDARQAQSTAAALDIADAKAQADAAAAVTRAQVWAWAWPLILVVLVYLGSRIIWDAYSQAMEWADRHKSIINTPQGVVKIGAWTDSGYDIRLLLPPEQTAAPRRLVDLNAAESEIESIQLTQSGSVWQSDIRRNSQPDGVTVLAVRLLLNAVAVSGRDSDKVPGWRELEWSADTWQRTVSALKATGAVETRQGIGTFTAGGYRNLGELLYALQNHQIKVRPVVAG